MDDISIIWRYSPPTISIKKDILTICDYQRLGPFPFGPTILSR